jgi:hypothetical protein
MLEVYELHLLELEIARLSMYQYFTLNLQYMSPVMAVKTPTIGISNINSRHIDRHYSYNIFQMLVNKGISTLITRGLQLELLFVLC